MGIPLKVVVYSSLLYLYYIHTVCKPYHRKGKQILHCDKIYLSRGPRTR